MQRLDTMARRVAVVVLAGVVLTGVAALFTRHESDRLRNERIDARADRAIASVNGLAARIAAVVGTARGIATSAPAPTAMQAALRQAVQDQAGVAVLDGNAVTVRTGTLDLLERARPHALAAPESATIVAHDHTESGYVLGLASAVVPGRRAVYVEVVVPIPPNAGTSFVVRAASDGSLLLGNVRGTGGLVDTGRRLVVGGMPAIVWAAAPGGASNDPLLLVVLFGGFATWCATIVVRRWPATAPAPVAADAPPDEVRDVAAGLAHEINDRITATLACSELIDGESDDATRRRFAGDLHDAARSGAELVERLLSVVEREYQPALVDANELVQRVQPRLQDALNGRAQLEIECAPHPCAVHVDGRRFEDALAELTAQTAAAIEAGGAVRVTTALEAADATRGTGSVVLVITGTGTKLVRRAARDEIASGAAAEVVRRAGGAFDVAPLGRTGLTIRIALPWQPSRDHRAAAFDAEPGRTSVLVVEPHDALRRSTAAVLERAGFAVHAVRRGADALRALDRRRYDVVVVEAIMPGLSGPDLCLRVQARHADAAFVLVSRYASDFFAAHAAPTRCVTVRKPFTSAELLDAVRTVSPPPTVRLESSGVR